MFTRDSYARSELQQLRDEVAALRSSMGAALARLGDCETECAALRKAILKLNGVFYGEQGGRPPGSGNRNSREKTKAEILRERFTPGRPVVHGEE